MRLLHPTLLLCSLVASLATAAHYQPSPFVVEAYQIAMFVLAVSDERAPTGLTKYHCVPNPAQPALDCTFLQPPNPSELVAVIQTIQQMGAKVYGANYIEKGEVYEYDAERKTWGKKEGSEVPATKHEIVVDAMMATGKFFKEISFKFEAK